MSHELRTPLNSLLILSQMLSENKAGNLTGKQVEFAQTIYTSGSDLLSLIDDILDLSKVEAGKMEVHPGPVVMEAIRDYVHRTFHPVADEKGLELNIEVAGSAPASVVTDELRLQQVLKNLLSNALKFTQKGSVVLSIDTAPAGMVFDHEALRRAGSVVAFRVTDTGIGMSADQLAIIFEAFQQADGTTSRKYGGTGLGLSISREIARLLGGEIKVESAEGQGSTFTLYLPLAFEPRVVEPVEVSDEPEPPSTIAELEEALASVNVEAPADGMIDASLLLSSEVIDDRDSIQQGDKVLLTIAGEAEEATAALAAARERGFKGLVSLRGDVGTALAHEFQPDVIVLDMQLTGTEGFAILDHLKHNADTRHIPVFTLSSVDLRQQAMKAGAAAYYAKPVDAKGMEELLSQATEFIDRRVKNLLIVEDDDTQRSSIVDLLSGDDISITAVGSSEEAIAKLDKEYFDCMVLDLKLPEMSGFKLLETVKRERARTLPVIVYTGKELTRREETRLKKYAQTIIVKDASSPERLLDETSLFLHRVHARMPLEKRRMLEHLHTEDAIFDGKKILIVDDDVRNVFALSSVLEMRGMDVLFAENGKDGIETLKANPSVDLVLMDIMMPEMDGYQTTRAIRALPEFEHLPVIALTAKAMKGDRDKSIEAGASDYITKPVDVDQLLSLMRVWLYQTVA
jgi:CheY-like chemotaxis protein